MRANDRRFWEALRGPSGVGRQSSINDRYGAQFAMTAVGREQTARPPSSPDNQTFAYLCARPFRTVAPAGLGRWPAGFARKIPGFVASPLRCNVLNKHAARDPREEAPSLQRRIASGLRYTGLDQPDTTIARMPTPLNVQTARENAHDPLLEYATCEVLVKPARSGGCPVDLLRAYHPDHGASRRRNRMERDCGQRQRKYAAPRSATSQPRHCHDADRSPRRAQRH